jgi:tripartite-type tricarboxylate transporter receptor subunit TctC
MLVKVALLVLAAGLVPWTAGAQTGYPERAITIVVPLPPGGPADSMARVVAQKMQERLKQSVVVENKPGAAGLIGTETVARAKPDGYTLVLVNSALVLQSATQPQTIRFDVHKDLQPITYAVRVPMILAASAEAPFKTVKEMVEYSKTRPGALTVGVSPGKGGSGHLMLERMKLGVGLDTVVVAYKGSAPAMQALLGNEVPAVIDSLTGAAPHLASGRVRALASFTETRPSSSPQIPTIGEAGFPGYEIDGWNGFMAPGGTPQPIVRFLNREITEILQLPDVKAKIQAFGLEPAPNTPEQFADSLTRGIALWTKVVKEAGLTFD